MATKTKNPAKTAKARRRKPKDESGYLPGAEFIAPPSIPELDNAAEHYRNMRDARMAAGEEEQEAAAALLAEMHKQNLKEYEYDGYVCRISLLEKVRVNKAKSENGDE